MSAFIGGYVTARGSPGTPSGETVTLACALSLGLSSDRPSTVRHRLHSLRPAPSSSYGLYVYTENIMDHKKKT